MSDYQNSAEFRRQERQFSDDYFAMSYPITNFFLTIFGWVFNIAVWLFLAALFIRLVGWVFHG